MTSASTSYDNPKISPAFAARLAKLRPGQQIRAIVLPAAPPELDLDGTMARSARRKAVAEAMMNAVSKAFKEIDHQLTLTGGRRLTNTPNRLGFILIQAPASTIRALAAQDWVSAIIEDQSLRHIQPIPDDNETDRSDTP